MSLTLKESVHLYDRYCRRHLDTPTFEDFNSAHFTCLPSMPEIYEEYNRVLKTARKATGVPVTRRLPSLYDKFTGRQGAPELTTRTQVQIPPQSASFKSTLPGMGDSVKMNIRAPSCIPIESPNPESKKYEKNVSQSESPITLKECWSIEGYKESLSKNKSILLKESGGHMVHLVPSHKNEKESFESLTCKLTKSTWETLRGKSEAPLKMRDGTAIHMASISLNEGDLAEFVQNRKAKMKGPHFIRFSRI